MINFNWNRLTKAPPLVLNPWLNDPGSFMLRLRAHGIENPRVQVLQQGWQLPYEDERLELGLLSRRYALVREVLILSEQKIWMYARSVFPLETLQGEERRFIHLKNRSLGTLLFKDPRVIRADFDFTCLQPESAAHQKISIHTKSSEKEIWGRRSLFFIRHKPLLLEEFFLPTAFEVFKEE